MRILRCGRQLLSRSYRYAKDIQHSNRLENGDFTFGITVRHGNDPMLIARDVTNKQRPK